MAPVPKGNNENVTDEDVAEVTSEMLQSPIFYITGHKSPLLRMRPLEKELLGGRFAEGTQITVDAASNGEGVMFNTAVKQAQPA